MHTEFRTAKRLLFHRRNLYLHEFQKDVSLSRNLTAWRGGLFQFVLTLTDRADLTFANASLSAGLYVSEPNTVNCLPHSLWYQWEPPHMWYLLYLTLPCNKPRYLPYVFSSAPTGAVCLPFWREILYWSMAPRVKQTSPCWQFFVWLIKILLLQMPSQIQVLSQQLSDAMISR